MFGLSETAHCILHLLAWAFVLVLVGRLVRLLAAAALHRLLVPLLPEVLLVLLTLGVALSIGIVLLIPLPSLLLPQFRDGVILLPLLLLRLPIGRLQVRLLALLILRMPLADLQLLDLRLLLRRAALVFLLVPR